MTKKITILALSLIFLTTLFQNTKIEAGASGVLKDIPTQPEQIVSKKLDNQAQILQKYLAKFNSPMQYQAQDFIDASEAYGLDWRMLPAIAGVESTFGKHIPGGYNAYDWAIYNSNSRFGFKSWRDGMFIVAKGLREGYLNKGLTNPYSMNRIYATSPHWGKNVTFFMNDLEKFANSYQSDDQQITKIGDAPNIAAISGQIASINQ